MIEIEIERRGCLLGWLLGYRGEGGGREEGEEELQEGNQHKKVEFVNTNKTEFRLCDDPNAIPME